MPLTDLKLRNLKPRPTVYRIADLGGLSIEVRPTGARLWRYRFRFGGKASMIPLGEYPAMSLQEARRELDRQKQILATGQNPSEARRLRKLQEGLETATTFEAIAREWSDRQHWRTATAEKNQWLLETYAFPVIGKRPIRAISPSEMLALIRRPETQGKLETAQRLKQRCGQVFRYAIASERADLDPTAALRGAVLTPKTQHHASIVDRREIGGLMRAIHGYSGQATTLAALKLSALTFTRPGELRQWEWSEINEAGDEWRIPSTKMKMGITHIVPLSVQAQSVLAELRTITGRRRYLFPCLGKPLIPMSEGTINAALRRLGYDGKTMTAHGFRSMASTVLNEDGWNRDWIERQLAHVEKDQVRGAYNYAQYMPGRRKMMQAWADMLDTLRVGGQVVPIHHALAG